MNVLDRILRDRIASRRPFRPAEHGRTATAWGIDAATAKQHGYADALPGLVSAEASPDPSERLAARADLSRMVPVPGLEGA